jgi:hypothetical protein
VIDALHNGQVNDVIIGPDRGAAASRCTGCGALFAASRPACPYCQAPCETRNLWQEVLATAMNHGLRVHLVNVSAEMAQHGGVAALLARDEPQWTSAAAP